jgi:hypothetical protein
MLAQLEPQTAPVSFALRECERALRLAEWLPRGSAALAAIAHDICARLLLLEAEETDDASGLPQALEHLDASNPLWALAGLPDGAISGGIMAADALRTLDVARAETLARRALSAAEAVGDPILVAKALRALGAITFTRTIAASDHVGARHGLDALQRALAALSAQGLAPSVPQQAAHEAGLAAIELGVRDRDSALLDIGLAALDSAEKWGTTPARIERAVAHAEARSARQDGASAVREAALAALTLAEAAPRTRRTCKLVARARAVLDAPPCSSARS